MPHRSGRAGWWSRPPLSIVFAWEQDVEAYAAAGREVEVPRLGCPSCGRPLVLKSGYPRWAREAREWRIWIRRGLCGICGRSHRLLPSFLLERRLDVVEVIGEGLRRSVAGEGPPKIAVALGRPYSTVRDWRRRHRERAGELVGELAARVVDLGGEVPKLSGAVEQSVKRPARPPRQGAAVPPGHAGTAARPDGAWQDVIPLLDDATVRSVRPGRFKLNASPRKLRGK